MICPNCGGDCWDNRERKLEGKIKPNAPDFKCKDTNCGWVKWPSKPKTNGYGKTPEEQKSIVRQHSQEMALRYAGLKGKKDIKPAELIKLVDWFQKDANGVVIKVKNTTEEPPDDAAPSDVQDVEEEVNLDDIPF
jgi:hypothetical protein